MNLLFNDFRHFLESFGFSISGLFLSFVCFFLVLLFAAREILSWMTRSHSILTELKKIRKEIDSLQAQVQALQKSEPEKPQEPSLEATLPSSKKLGGKINEPSGLETKNLAQPPAKANHFPFQH